MSIGTAGISERLKLGLFALVGGFFGLGFIVVLVDGINDGIRSTGKECGVSPSVIDSTTEALEYAAVALVLSGTAAYVLSAVRTASKDPPTFTVFVAVGFLLFALVVGGGLLVPSLICGAINWLHG